MVPPFLPTLAADFTTESTAFSVLCIQTQRQRHTETNTHTHERKLKTHQTHKTRVHKRTNTRYAHTIAIISSLSVVLLLQLAAGPFFESFAPLWPSPSETAKKNNFVIINFRWQHAPSKTTSRHRARRHRRIPHLKLGCENA